VAVNPDFRDLFAALNAAGARYLLVGGYAVALATPSRYLPTRKGRKRLPARGSGSRPSPRVWSLPRAKTCGLVFRSDAADPTETEAGDA